MKVLIIGLCKAAIIECRETIVKGLIDVKRINLDPKRFRLRLKLALLITQLSGSDSVQR